MRETWVWSLGWEDPLEKEMATYSSTLAWKIPWTEEPGSPWSETGMLGNFGVASRVPSSISNFKLEEGVCYAQCILLAKLC